MRAAADSTPTGDSLRLAVLAALNIADELFRCRETTRARDGELAERAGELERLARPRAHGLAEPTLNLEPEPERLRFTRAFEFPALRVMAEGSFEPTFHLSESRRRVVCMPLYEEA